MDNLGDPVLRHARTDFVAIRAHKTVREVLEDIRTAPMAGTVFYLYVVNDEDQLIGVIQTRSLLRSPLDCRADAIMRTNVVAIPDSCTLLDACEFFVLHRFLAFPVVDRNRRILGVVDVGLFTEEMFDIEKREQVHSMFETLGVSISDVRAKSGWSAFRDRSPWLFTTIISGTICAVVVGLFQLTLAKSLILAFFMTLVLGLAESMAMQAVGITVHSLHHRTPEGGWYWTIPKREMKRSFLLGIAGAFLVGCIAVLWQRDVPAGAVIACGISASVLLACFLGVSIPVLLHRLRLDLRVASGPTTLALTDIGTITIYFSLAVLILGR